MAKKHRWISNTCIKCGLNRTPKTRKILMAIINTLPGNVYKYEQYFEYHNGISVLDKRPDCNVNN
jgi:hypothetical protein